MAIEAPERQDFACLRPVARPRHIRATPTVSEPPVDPREPSPAPRDVDYYEPKANEWETDLQDLRGRLVKAFAFLVFVTLVGVVGFSVIDPDAGVIRAFYMTAITLTTVGYGEVVAVETDGARLFTAMLILVGMGGTLYFVSTVTAFIIEGQLGHVFRRKKMERELANLEGHMIVCGSGPTAIYAVTELAAVERPVVLVAASASEAEEFTSDVPAVPVVLGDPTDDDVLRAAGIERAGGLIACSESDNQNVVITLTARQLNPAIRIVARLQDVDQEAKVRKVGADAVVSPQHIGGLRLASELIRPTVVTFLDTMLRDRDRNLRVDEIFIPEGAPAAGRRIRDLDLGRIPGILLLAMKDGEGWEYNPGGDQVVRANTVLIFLGSPEDARALRQQLDGARPTDLPAPV